MIKYVGLFVFMGLGFVLLASNVPLIGILLIVSTALGTLVFDRKPKVIPKTGITSQVITVPECKYCGTVYNNVIGRLSKCANCGAPM